jgi:hypothetical protein
LSALVGLESCKQKIKIKQNNWLIVNNIVVFIEDNPNKRTRQPSLLLVLVVVAVGGCR